MRTTILISLLFCVLSAFGNVNVLSIGIGHYPSGSGWCDLGAVNDVELMKGIFPSVTTLVDKQATHFGMAEALRNLESRSMSGDTVIVHFSGHGQQVLALHDSNEPDKVDEALVAYDAHKTLSLSYSGEAHFIDDEFGAVLSALRQKVGSKGLVLAVIDACHSNSMDRDADNKGYVYRGTDDVLGAENLSQQEVDSLRDVYNKKETASLIQSEDMSDLILISACETDQRNYETKAGGDTPYGSLSYYFAKAVREHGFSDMALLLTSVYNSMSEDQTMELFGQHPVIRNTIGWVAPKKETFEPQNLPVPGTPTEAKNYTLFIILISVGVIIIIAFICWKKKKK